MASDEDAMAFIRALNKMRPEERAALEQLVEWLAQRPKAAEALSRKDIDQLLTVVQSFPRK